MWLWPCKRTHYVGVSTVAMRNCPNREADRAPPASLPHSTGEDAEGRICRSPPHATCEDGGGRSCRSNQTMGGESVSASHMRLECLKLLWYETEGHPGALKLILDLMESQGPKVVGAFNLYLSRLPANQFPDTASGTTRWTTGYPL